jgi:hypothetical protein
MNLVIEQFVTVAKYFVRLRLEERLALSYTRENHEKYLANHYVYP